MQNLELCQFVPETKKGHYESFFLRANHPKKPQAFWIRFTIFSPKGSSDKTIGEIWAMYFDATSDSTIAVQEDIPIAQCNFANDKLDIRIGKNKLLKGHSSGSTSSNQHTFKWDLSYKGDNDQILLFPKKLYSTALPKAKSLVTAPNIIFTGSFEVNGKDINIDGWQGSENHNWGSKHTDEYAWGQIAGFDNDPNAFLECSTARIKLGPVWSPWMTLAVLLINGERYAFNSIRQSIKASAEYDFFNWHFSTQDKNAKLIVNISAPKEHFAGLNYKNPPKGSHTCLNSKIASCEVKFIDKKGQSRILHTKNRAAFEILTDLKNHGVPVQNI